MTGLAHERREARNGSVYVFIGWLVAVSEILILIGSLLVMWAGLKTNGQLFTETLENTRRETWAVGSGLAIAAVAGSLGYFLIRFVKTRSGGSLVLGQFVLMLLIIGLAVWFHRAIPVPPGTYTTGIPAY